LQTPTYSAGFADTHLLGGFAGLQTPFYSERPESPT
jgi:hypothetical protein